VGLLSFAAASRDGVRRMDVRANRRQTVDRPAQGTRIPREGIIHTVGKDWEPLWR
jgi:hypothetical protein